MSGHGQYVRDHKVRSDGSSGAAADAGIGALQRAEDRGHQRGYEQGQQEVIRAVGEGAARAELERLRSAVATFEEGIRAAGRRCPPGRPGGPSRGIVALIENATADSAWAATTIRSHATRLGRNAEELNALADALAGDLESVSPGDVTRRREDRLAEGAAPTKPGCGVAAEGGPQEARRGPRTDPPIPGCGRLRHHQAFRSHRPSSTAGGATG